MVFTAKIISVSLGEELLKEIEVLKGSGFSGRSEVIRSGIKLLLDDVKEKERLKGHVECIMVFVHGKKFENTFTKTTHKYENIISTQVHNNLCNDKCLEVFVLHGPADRIKGFFSDVRKNRRVDYAKLVVP